jgi:hypothetical protein
MRTITHPFEQAGPNMVVGFDADGKRVALEIIDDDSDDAARYRWLRANAKEIVFRAHEIVTCYGSSFDDKEELDAAVDAAMKKIDE